MVQDLSLGQPNIVHQKDLKNLNELKSKWHQAFQKKIITTNEYTKFLDSGEESIDEKIEKRFKDLIKNDLPKIQEIIENELKKLNNERSPLTEQIITDALEQVQLLENDYQNLKTDLTESGSDQRVIYAMITNFQSRIDILNTVLEQIEIIKELKINTDEPKNTI